MTKPIPDQIPIPDSFRAAHYHQHDVCELLGITEPQFWPLYLAGEIPAGVPLMRQTGQPLLIWPRADIDAWLAAECPPDVELQDRIARVMQSLAACIEREYGMRPDQVAELINSRN